MKTNQNVSIDFRDYGTIIVPENTSVTHQTATGVDLNYHFVNNFDWIKKDYPTIANILLFDAIHYGIDIPKEFIAN